MYDNHTMSEQERNLRDRAEQVRENTAYNIHLSEAQVKEMKENVGQNQLEVQRHSDYIKDYKDEHIKPLKDRNKAMIKELRSGVREQRGTLYGIVNAKKLTMEYFTPEGELIESETRSLNREERNRLGINNFTESIPETHRA